MEREGWIVAPCDRRPGGLSGLPSAGVVAGVLTACSWLRCCRLGSAVGWESAG